MKIKSLHIDTYRHLENVHFDFTYPEGHEKAGQPLEKICIIGQSATGKTSVLELIKNSIKQLKAIEVYNGQFFWNYFQLNFDGKLDFIYNNTPLQMAKDSIIKEGREFKNFTGNKSATIGDLIQDGIKLLYLSSELISPTVINIFNQNPVDISNELATEKYAGLGKRHSASNYIYEFIQDINVEIWFSLLDRILIYRKKFHQWASEILNKGVIGDLTKLNKQIAKWNETNLNPLVDFSEKFNPLLNKLNLEIDLVNTEYTIPVKSTLKDEVIPISGLSTGTKGLLLSMFPLYELDTTDAIILMDEPERSLFPDIQLELMDTYKNLAPNAQIIVATHSPFIAAAFEPEERFILYFNEDGKVAVRRGESPIGDDPNDMLYNDFKVSYYNEFGKAAYKEYINLKRKAMNEEQPEEKKKLVLEMSKLGNKYNF